MEYYIKVYRKALENGWLKNHKLWAFWTYLLLSASYKERAVMVGFDRIELKPGQLIFGRKSASEKLGMSEQSIRTCLEKLKKAGNLTSISTSKYTVVTIVNWEFYQGTINEINQQINQQLTNKQPATNHILERIEYIEDNNIYSQTAKEILEHLNKSAGLPRGFKPVKSNLKWIIARFNEDKTLTINHFKAVIDFKVKSWKGGNYEKYLRPETLFGNKFQGYLNEALSKKPVQFQNKELDGNDYFKKLQDSIGG